jgi:predicted transcriptional regulator
MGHVERLESPQPVPIELNEKRYDNLYATVRPDLYHELARYWHHRRDPYEYEVHYNRLTRINRKCYNLNYPKPQPKEKREFKLEEGTHFIGTQTQTMTGTSYLSTTTSRFKSRYATSRRLGQTLRRQKRIDLSKQILESASSGNFVENEKVIAMVVRMLRENGYSAETIEIGLKNAVVKTTVNLATSELEISVHI